MLAADIASESQSNISRPHKKKTKKKKVKKNKPDGSQRPGYNEDDPAAYNNDDSPDLNYNNLNDINDYTKNNQPLAYNNLRPLYSDKASVDIGGLNKPRTGSNNEPFYNLNNP